MAGQEAPRARGVGRDASHHRSRARGDGLHDRCGPARGHRRRARARCLRRLGRAGDRDALARRRLRPHLRRRPGRSSAHPQEPRADGRRPVGGASCAATCSPRLRAAAFSAAPSIWCSSTRPTRWAPLPSRSSWGICGSGALSRPGRSPCTSTRRAIAAPGRRASRSCARSAMASARWTCCDSGRGQRSGDGAGRR